MSVCVALTQKSTFYGFGSQAFQSLRFNHSSQKYNPEMSATLASRLKAKSAPLRSPPASSDEDNLRQIFRGFIPGHAYSTKKGHHGVAITTAWSKNIVRAFENDDVELVEVSLKSSLANLNAVVDGGLGGAPFSIGEFGFYTEAQFSAQTALLCERDRQNAHRRKIFFSDSEWTQVDGMLGRIAHHSSTQFENACRGDSFGALALRKDAFNCASYFLRGGIDPLRENEDGQDMFIIARERYMSLSVKLKCIIPRQQEYLTVGPRIRSTVDTLRRDCTALGDQFTALKNFALALQQVLEARRGLIDADEHFLRRCELLNEPCPKEKLWNIEQRGKLEQHLTDLVVLIEYSQQKVLHSQRLIERFEAEVLQLQRDEEASRAAALQSPSRAVQLPPIQRALLQSPDAVPVVRGDREVVLYK